MDFVVAFGEEFVVIPKQLVKFMFEYFYLLTFISLSLAFSM